MIRDVYSNSWRCRSQSIFMAPLSQQVKKIYRPKWFIKYRGTYYSEDYSTTLHHELDSSIYVSTNHRLMVSLVVNIHAMIHLTWFYIHPLPIRTSTSASTSMYIVTNHYCIAICKINTYSFPITGTVIYTMLRCTWSKMSVEVNKTTLYTPHLISCVN